MSKINEARRDAHLATMFRWPDGQVESLRARITAMVATGQASLTYRHGTGKKRDGMRLPTRPVWTLWISGEGVDLSKIAAEFAASLMASPPDLRAMQEQGEAAYQQAMR